MADDPNETAGAVGCLGCLAIPLVPLFLALCAWATHCGWSAYQP